MLILLFLLLAARTDLVSPAEPAHSSCGQEKSVFILAGQSNMSGRGGVVNGTWDGVVPSECRPNRSILRLSAQLTWVETREPLHKDIDVNKTCGVGPGMAFANSVLEKDPSLGVIGLVPCAIGGTNISQWVRGSFLYNQTVQRAAAAVQSGGMIRAVLWYQGESDAENWEDADHYKGRLEKFFTDLRCDLGSPLLPIIQVALASGGPYTEKVREAQLEIKMENVRTVDGKGLALEPPELLHLTTPAQVQLGEMMADAFLRTRPGPLHSRAGFC
ncbi:hypothetical protein NMG60_11016481 [Bertholletia excelsa]